MSVLFILFIRVFVVLESGAGAEFNLKTLLAFIAIIAIVAALTVFADHERKKSDR